MKRAWSLVLAIPLTVIMSACSTSPTTGSEDQDGTTQADDSSVVIGFSNATQQSPFYVALGDSVQKKGKELGADVEYVDANGDVNKQNQDIQDLITKGVDVLLINPVDPKGITPSVKAANAADIPILTVDQPADNVDTFVGRDNVKMSKLVGEEVADQLGDSGGTVIEILGAAGSIVTKDRAEGFENAIQDNENINLVKGPNADYVRSKAVTAMQDLLQAHPDVKVVYAENDDMALGALQVLKKNDRDDVKVAGIDGLMEAVKAIASGDQYIATALNDPVHEGEVAAQTAFDMAGGESPSSFVDVGSALITSDNVDDYVGSELFAPTKD